MKEQLDFNTDFLKETQPLPSGQKKPVKDKKAADTSFRNWMIVLAAIVVFMVIGSLSEPSSSTSTTPTYSPPPSRPAPAGTPPVSNNVQVGEYSCSSHNADRADNLEPDTTSEILKGQLADLDSREESLDSFSDRIDSTYVDENDQDSIDDYNVLIDRYNTTSSRLKLDIAAYNARIRTFNSQVETYNAFLENNCTRN